MTILTKIPHSSVYLDLISQNLLTTVTDQIFPTILQDINRITSYRTIILMLRVTFCCQIKMTKKKVLITKTEFQKNWNHFIMKMTIISIK